MRKKYVAIRLNESEIAKLKFHALKNGLTVSGQAGKIVSDYLSSSEMSNPQLYEKLSLEISRAVHAITDQIVKNKQQSAVQKALPVKEKSETHKVEMHEGNKLQSINEEYLKKFGPYEGMYASESEMLPKGINPKTHNWTCIAQYRSWADFYGKQYESEVILRLKAELQAKGKNEYTGKGK